MRRVLMVALGGLAVWDLISFGADPPGHVVMLPLSLFTVFVAWRLYRVGCEERAAERMAGQWQESVQRNLGLGGVRPRGGWQYRSDGTTVAIRCVPTEDPTVFLVVTIDGEPVWPDDGGIVIDTLGPGQNVVHQRTTDPKRKS